jgi:hypothetical protein
LLTRGEPLLVLLQSQNLDRPHDILHELLHDLSCLNQLEL